jgi:hypothetical protein
MNPGQLQGSVLATGPEMQVGRTFPCRFNDVATLAKGRVREEIGITKDGPRQKPQDHVRVPAKDVSLGRHL